MEFVNVPAKAPENVYHRTFYSRLYGHELGYNVYLPPEYEGGNDRYPVLYHLHGWTDNESTDIWPLEKIYKSKRAIVVFPNSSPVIGDRENWPVELMLVDELIPRIDKEYRTDAARESRSVSGFSMGGGMAFHYAVNHTELFCSVTAYAGTYHHYFHKGSHTVEVVAEKAAEILENMMEEKRYLEENNILCWVRQGADRIRGKLRIALHIGTADPLACDNEILHLYLDSLDIPHDYKKFDGAAHELSRIIM